MIINLKTKTVPGLLAHETPLKVPPPQGFSVNGISQARIAEWLSFPSPGDLPTQRLNMH